MNWTKHRFHFFVQNRVKLKVIIWYRFAFSIDYSSEGQLEFGCTVPDHVVSLNTQAKYLELAVYLTNG